ncbi:MAG TPA: N-6 DNA methylase [Herpetosiphonaceae bacterium]
MGKRRTPRRARALRSPSATDILDLLDRCSARCGPSLGQVFTDWLDLVEAVLDDLHAPWRNLMSGAPAPLPSPATADAVWATLAPRYQHPDACSLLSQACGALLAGAANQVSDDIGAVSMHACLGDDQRGQFFTPWNVCLAMAQMAILDGAAAVEARIAAAIAKSPDAQAAHADGSHLAGDQALAWRIARVLPHAAPHIERITVIDPACGSGRMLLAASTQYPAWANALGLVSYVGIDADSLCTRMARLNVKLFGLDGLQAALVLLHAEQTLKRAARVSALRSIMTDAGASVVEAIADLQGDVEAATGGSIAVPWDVHRS